MGLVVTTTFAFALWIVLWALGGVGGEDPFVVTMVVILLGAAGRILLSHLPGRE